MTATRTWQSFSARCTGLERTGAADATTMDGSTDLHAAFSAVCSWKSMKVTAIWPAWRCSVIEGENLTQADNMFRYNIRH